MNVNENKNNKNNKKNDFLLFYKLNYITYIIK